MNVAYRRSWGEIFLWKSSANARKEKRNKKERNPPMETDADMEIPNNGIFHIGLQKAFGFSHSSPQALRRFNPGYFLNDLTTPPKVTFLNELTGAGHIFEAAVIL